MFKKLWALFRPAQRSSNGKPENVTLLADPINCPETLDRLWGYYEVSGDERAVYRILSVLDWEDLVRSRLQAWLNLMEPASWASAQNLVYKELLLRCTFPIDFERRTIDEQVDLDLHVALLARNGELKFSELPIPLSIDEIQRLGMKSAALWSLRSQAKRFSGVAAICRLESTKPGGAARFHLAG